MAKGFKDDDGKFHPTEKPKLSGKPNIPRDVEREGSTTKVDQLKAEELKQKKTGEDFRIIGAEAFWSIDREEDSYDLSLHDPVGWSWSGNEDDMLGFLARINRSKAKDNFLNEIKQLKELKFSEIKKILIKNTDTDDVLYEVTGDNNTWGSQASPEEQVDSQFEFDDFIEQLEMDLNDEQQEQLTDLTWSKFNVDFDEFKDEDTGKRALEDLKKAINSSNGFEELFQNLDEEQQGFLEDASSYISGQFLKALDESGKELGFK